MDSLIESKFEKLTRRPGKYLLRVLSSVYNAINIGLKTKINCVLMAGTNDDEVKDFVNLTKNSSLDVRFIEYMPFDGNKWSNDYVMGYRKVLDNLEYGHGMKLTMDKSSKRSSRRQNQSVDTNTVTDSLIYVSPPLNNHHIISYHIRDYGFHKRSDGVCEVYHHGESFFGPHWTMYVNQNTHRE